MTTSATAKTSDHAVLPYTHTVMGDIAPGCAGGTTGLDARLQSARARILADKIPALEITRTHDDLAPLQTLAAQLRQSCDTVLVLGTGGSSLGGQTLQSLIPPQAHPHPNVIFMDNVDAGAFHTTLQNLNPQRTGVVIISKSGQTLETLAQTLALFQAWQIAEHIEAFRSRLYVITEDKPNEHKSSPLRQLAQDFQLTILPHRQDIGGRFSVFSNVGALPALLMGLDVARLRQGAQTVYDHLAGTADHPADQHPAYQGAAFLLHAHAAHSSSQAVWWSYGEALSTLGQWWQQLFGESLGKRAHNQTFGMTPIGARGTVDQHSQLQLYIDGPADKAFTMLLGPQADNTLPLWNAPDPALSYLQGKTLDDVMHVEFHATCASLQHNGRPVRQITLSAWNEEVVGALLMHCMLETLLMAYVWDINPFDQPAVEHGKILAKDMLQRDMLQRA
jgi:glucose-6-phosphate isomerase